MKKLLLVHPMLVIATKTTNLGERYSANEVQRNFFFPDTPDYRNVASTTHKLPYREYMPSVWQRQLFGSDTLDLVCSFDAKQGYIHKLSNAAFTLLAETLSNKIGAYLKLSKVQGGVV
ncbi:hypothetical protein L484_024153 [Morus notabilis]|uniref:Uncharacterized protein n=1 Tax=Morus notabilis TaxID=981085 RepID=W9RMA0_9ROSA|nr:hypothetical protein L484_024153 [Morus notabilis]